MELQILDTKGIPENAIVSIRAGTTRRQAPFSADRGPLRFPSLPLNANPLKIDVLQPIASHRMDITPQNGEYAVSMGDNMSMSFAVTEQPGLCGKPSSELRAESNRPGTSDTTSSKNKLQSALDAREYLDEHNLFKYVQEMLKFVITEKPQDPYDFMIDYLQKRKTNPTSSTSPAAPSGPKPDNQRPPTRKDPSVSGEEAQMVGVDSSAVTDAESKAKAKQALSNGLASGDLAKAVNSAASFADPPAKPEAKARKSIDDDFGGYAPRDYFLEESNQEDISSMSKAADPASSSVPQQEDISAMSKAPDPASYPAPLPEAEVKALCKKWLTESLLNGSLATVLAPPKAPSETEPKQYADVKAKARDVLEANVLNGNLEACIELALKASTSEVQMKAKVKQMLNEALASGALIQALPPAASLNPPCDSESKAQSVIDLLSPDALRKKFKMCFTEAVNSGALEKALPPASSEPEAKASAAPEAPASLADKAKAKCRTQLEEGLASGALDTALLQASPAAQASQESSAEQASKSVDAEAFVAAKESIRVKLEDALVNKTLEAVLVSGGLTSARSNVANLDDARAVVKEVLTEANRTGDFGKILNDMTSPPVSPKSKLLQEEKHKLLSDRQRLEEENGQLDGENDSLRRQLRELQKEAER